MNNNTLRKKSHFQVNLKRSVHVKFFFKKWLVDVQLLDFKDWCVLIKKTHIKKYDRLHLNSLEMLQTSFSFTIFLL